MAESGVVCDHHPRYPLTQASLQTVTDQVAQCLTWAVLKMIQQATQLRHLRGVAGGAMSLLRAMTVDEIVGIVVAVGTAKVAAVDAKVAAVVGGHMEVLIAWEAFYSTATRFR